MPELNCIMYYMYIRNPEYIYSATGLKSRKLSPYLFIVH